MELVCPKTDPHGKPLESPSIIRPISYVSGVPIEFLGSPKIKELHPVVLSCFAPPRKIANYKTGSIADNIEKMNQTLKWKIFQLDANKYTGLSVTDPLDSIGHELMMNNNVYRKALL